MASLNQQFFDETTSFEFVEQFDPFAKPILSQLIDLGFVELVFVGDFEDEVALFIGAGPFIGFRLRLLMTVAVTIAVGFDRFTGQETDLLNAAMVLLPEPGNLWELPLT